MQSMRRFLRDTTVQGRFFPQGAQVQKLAAGDMALVLPDPGTYTTLCSVPAEHLAPLRQFRVVLVNRRVGLLAEQLRWAVDADDVKSAIARTAPDCEIVELDQFDGWW